MKKFYLLLSAACVIASASAVEKQMAVSKQRLHDQATRMEFKAMPKMQKTDIAKLPKMAQKSSQNRIDLPGTPYAFFTPADQVMAIGYSETGYGYSVVYGFASSYGSLDFLNYSSGAKSYEWTYTNLGDYVLEETADGTHAVWTYQTSDAENLSIKSGIGEIDQVTLKATGTRSKTVKGNAVDFLCGGSGNFWLKGDDYDETGDWGVSFYQNFGLKNPKGNSGALTYFYSYDIDPEAGTSDQYNENGVSTESIKALQQYSGATSVENVHLNNFTVLNPAPTSTYALTKAWIRMQLEAADATQLISYIYEVDEDGQIGENPIAYGICPIEKGDNYLPVFKYVGLDEDGDEKEGEIYIDGPVAFTFEGFDGNDLIKNISVVSGFYPFSYKEYKDNGNYDIWRENNLYMNLTADLDGVTTENLIIASNSGYYFDKDSDDDTITGLGHAMLSMDAQYRFILAVNGEESVEIPVAGGSQDVVIEAMYYDIPGLIEEDLYQISYPEWLDVKIGAPNKDYECNMTIKAEATETPRYGEIKINGLGATFTLGVNQGENGVSIISTNGDVKYFDLAGRQVANPDKGVYIKVSGNKTEKVIL